MQEGNHEVRTAWGFLAVRLSMPENKEWAADRATILQGLGILDPDGKPTSRLEVVKAADVARLTQEAWKKEREKILKACNKCHSSNFAKAELEKATRSSKRRIVFWQKLSELLPISIEMGFFQNPKIMHTPSLTLSLSLTRPTGMAGARGRRA